MVKDVVSIILEQLITSDQYRKTVLPYIKREYFETVSERLIFDTISFHMDKYLGPPSKDALLIDVEKHAQATPDDLKKVLDIVSGWTNEQVNQNWLVESTELWCQNRALHLAFERSIKIYNDEGKVDARGEIPELMRDALSVSFDSDIGVSYQASSDLLYDLYHTKEYKIPCDISALNAMTDGGVEKGTVNLLMAPTGKGKSMWLCHLAAVYMSMGLKVVYITLEMREHKILERVDSNLLNMPSHDMKRLDKSSYLNAITDIKQRTKGDIVVKQFPTAAAHMGHFRHFLSELKNKKQYVPHVVLVDYLNICASSRLRLGAGVNTYTYVKSIAEEMRGLAIEMDVPFWSATQTNRDAVNASDYDEKAVSESFGSIMTMDFVAALISNDDLEELEQQRCKVLKNRYGPLGSFLVAIDRSKMKVFNMNLEESAEYAKIEQETKPSGVSSSKDYSGFSFD